MSDRHTTVIAEHAIAVNVDWPALLIGIVLLACLAAAGLYDLWVSVSGSNRATVSEIIRGWAQTFPPLLVAVGFLLGHLFWPAVRPPRS
jgi:hypothetical protein